MGKQNGIQLHAQGGWMEYGRNSTLIVFNNEGLMLDCGINVSAAISNDVHKIKPIFIKTIKKIKFHGVLLSHAHLDHIGAIPDLTKIMEGPVPCMGAEFTLNVCKNLKYDFSPQVLEPLTQYTFGVFKVIPMFIQHSIPGSYFYKIIVNNKVLCYASDFKIDLRPILGAPTELNSLKEQLGTVDYFIFDTTRGYSNTQTVSETYVYETLKEKIISIRPYYRNIFYCMFASHIARFKSVVKVCEQLGLNLYVCGKTFPVYVNAGINAGVYTPPSFVNFFQKNYAALFKGLQNSKDNLIIVSGVNAQPNAVFTRIADGLIPYSGLEKDYVILGGHEIPGSCYLRRILLNKLELKKVQYAEIHASGHSGLKDLLNLIDHIRPKVLIPTHSTMTSIGVLLDGLVNIGYNMSNKYCNKIYLIANTDIVYL